MAKKKATKINWLLVSVFGLILVLPYGIFTKLIGNEINCYLLLAFRYCVSALILLPFVVEAFRKQKKALIKKLPIIIVSCALLSLGFPLYGAAVSLSSVSFVEILLLFTPILFSIISFGVVKDKVSRNSIIGLLFAILGAAIITVIPIFLGNGAVIVFGWLPVFMVAVYMIAAAVEPVFMRRMNEQGVSILALMCISTIFCTITSSIYAINDAGVQVFGEISNLSSAGWAMLIYLGITTCIAAAMRYKAYTHIGTSTHATLNYLSSFLAIAAPIIVLGESLSWEVVLGGILILVGVVITRQHTHKYGRKHKRKHLHWPYHGSR